jgi:hypothetical protein
VRTDKRSTVGVLRKKETHMTQRDRGPNGSAERAAYYRERAAEARVRAEAARDHEARQSILQVASIWEYMADIAEPHEKRVRHMGPFAV